MRRKYSQTDFVASMLPSNRKKQFFDFFKTRKIILRKIFLLMLLFSLPFLVAYSFKYFFFIANAAVEYGDKSEEYIAFFKVTDIIFYAIDIICYSVMSIGYSGIFNIFKKMSWGEPIFFKSDFKEGVKNNWKIFFLVTLMLSVIRFALNSFIVLTNYHFVALIIYFIFMMIFPIFFIGLVLTNFYTAKPFETFSKASSFYLKKFGFVLLFLIYPLVIALTKYYVEEFFGMAILGFGLRLLNLVVIAPLFLLSCFLFSLSLFDEFTNKRYFKEFYHKGLSNCSIYNKKFNKEDTFLLK